MINTRSNREAYRLWGRSSGQSPSTWLKDLVLLFWFIYVSHIDTA